MSKKQKSTFELKPRHYVIGAAVVAVSAAIAIGVVTLLGGSSLSESKALERPPAVGPAPAIERSAAADILDEKSWDDMTPAERGLVRNEVTRVFDSGTFRATSELVFALDIYRRDGRTQASRLWQPIQTDQDRNRLAETLTFYCPEAEGKVHAYKYLKVPSKIELSEATADFGPQPWQQVLAGIDWTEVKDLGFKKIDGQRAHGFETAFEGAAGRTAVRHWVDVETARLLERSELADDGTELGAQRYELDWRQFQPLDLPSDQEKPGCVGEVQAALNESS